MMKGKYQELVKSRTTDKQILGKVNPDFCLCSCLIKKSYQNTPDDLETKQCQLNCKDLKLKNKPKSKSLLGDKDPQFTDIQNWSHGSLQHTDPERFEIHGHGVLARIKIM